MNQNWSDQWATVWADQCDPDLWLLREADQDDDQMVGDVGAGVQRDGHAGGGALVQGAVGQRPQQQPGQLTDVGHALNEFLWPESRKRKVNSDEQSGSGSGRRIHHPLTLPSRRQPCWCAKIISAGFSKHHLMWKPCKLFRDRASGKTPDPTNVINLIYSAVKGFCCHYRFIVFLFISLPRFNVYFK